MRKWASLIFIASLFFLTANIATAAASYSDKNHADVSFDISMPIDATDYTLHGKNLTGAFEKPLIVCWLNEI